MHRLLLIIAVFAAMGSGVTETAEAKHVRCISTHQAINFYRQATHQWQIKMGVPITRASKQPIRGCDYARWVAKLWVYRTKLWKSRYQEYREWQISMENPIEAIRYVFGRYFTQALAVARCESGLFTGATNGQYRGLFQMGSSERALYGHGVTALAQAQAAHRYFVASGKDWSPWECKPW